ncbi:MAG: formylglycine-generating enzyme family protein [Cyanobacteria bacterium P01_F01_bin.150]
MGKNHYDSVPLPASAIGERYQRLEIPILAPDQSQKTAQVVRWQTGGQQYIHLTCDERSWQGSGHDELACLIDIRQHFEHEGYRLLCYGASLNGSASGMSRDSDMVYQLEWGQPPKRAKTKSIHNIFDTGPDVISATYREQQIFKQQWLTGVKLDRKGIPYDLVEYPVVAVDHQRNVTRCSLEKNLVLTETLSDTALKLVFIPKGSFLMGVERENGNRVDNHYRTNEPQHKVHLKAFWLGQYPVTIAQWQAVTTLPQVQCEMRLEPSQHRPHVDVNLDSHPISCISWDEAIEFCARLSAHTGRSYRLPTEAEWEYACKAETTTPAHFGEHVLLKRSQLPDAYLSLVSSPSSAPDNQMYLLNYDHLMKGTTPVGSYPANPWGLYDMHGNVCEWCLDRWHDDYSTKPETVKWDGNRSWNTGGSGKKSLFQPVRGGTCWSSGDECQSMARQIGFRNADVDILYGLRVVCDAIGH